MMPSVETEFAITSLPPERVPVTVEERVPAVTAAPIAVFKLATVSVALAPVL